MIDGKRVESWVGRVCFTHHGEADVRLLQSGPVVGAIARDRHDLPVGAHFAIDDSLDKRVLVDGLRSSQDA